MGQAARKQSFFPDEMPRWSGRQFTNWVKANMSPLEALPDLKLGEVWLQIEGVFYGPFPKHVLPKALTDWVDD